MYAILIATGQIKRAVTNTFLSGHEGKRQDLRVSKQRGQDLVAF